MYFSHFLIAYFLKFILLSIGLFYQSHINFYCSFISRLLYNVKFIQIFALFSRKYKCNRNKNKKVIRPGSTEILVGGAARWRECVEPTKYCSLNGRFVSVAIKRLYMRADKRTSLALHRRYVSSIQGTISEILTVQTIEDTSPTLTTFIPRR